MDHPPSLLSAYSVMTQQLVMLEGRVGLANAAILLRQFSACGISSSASQQLDHSSTFETDNKQAMGRQSAPQNQDPQICHSLSSSASLLTSQKRLNMSSVLCSTTGSLLHSTSGISLQHLASLSHSHAYCSAAVGSAAPAAMPAHGAAPGAGKGGKAQPKLDMKLAEASAGAQPAAFVPGSHQDPSRNVNMRERR